MLMYIKPQIEILKAEFILMSGSGPGATDIGAPSVDDNYSVWDEEETQYNNKEEQNYEEDWI